jgi:hypothetical protein
MNLVAKPRHSCGLTFGSKINCMVSEELVKICFFSSQEYSSTSSIDASRFCRFMFLDSTLTIGVTNNSSDITQQAISRLFIER